MPKRNGGLTPRERAFAAAYAATGSVTEAGRRAGYAHQPAASKAIARPAVAAEAQRIALDRISNEILPLAVETHIWLLSSDKVGAGAKVQAVKLAYDRALGPADAQSGVGKELADMTPEEIDQELRRARAERAAAAKLVEALEIAGTAETVDSQADGAFD